MSARAYLTCLDLDVLCVLHEHERAGFDFLTELMVDRDPRMLRRSLRYLMGQTLVTREPERTRKGGLAKVRWLYSPTDAGRTHVLATHIAAKARRRAELRASVS